MVVVEVFAFREEEARSHQFLPSTFRVEMTALAQDVSVAVTFTAGGIGGRSVHRAVDRGIVSPPGCL
jgi:hypothetical protein